MLTYRCSFASASNGSNPLFPRFATRKVGKDLGIGLKTDAIRRSLFWVEARIDQSLAWMKNARMYCSILAYLTSKPSHGKDG